MSNVPTNEATSTKSAETETGVENDRDVNFDNLDLYADMGLKFLRDACVAFSDLVHDVDMWTPNAKLAKEVEVAMAEARSELRNIQNELKEAELKNTALKSELAALKRADAIVLERRAVSERMAARASETRAKPAKKAGR